MIILSLNRQKALITFNSICRCIATNEVVEQTSTPLCINAGGDAFEIGMVVTSCESILVPVDFSADSQEAMLQGLTLAESLSANILLLNVMQDHVGIHNDGSESHFDRKITQRSNKAEHTMKQFIKDNDYEVRARDIGSRIYFDYRNGSPASRILEAANDKSVGLIVMGGRGKSGLKKTSMGSTVEHVIRHASVPVLIAISGHGSQ